MPSTRIAIDDSALVSAVNRLREERGVAHTREIAATVGLSTTTAWRRLNELVEGGVLEQLGQAGFRRARA